VNWDEEVDVVSTGAGIAGLAHAVAVADRGGEVFVADSRRETHSSGTSVAVRSRVDRLHWLQVDVSDQETNEYFAALASDLGPLTRTAREVDVPIRVLDQATPVDPRGVVAPFIGARLRDWAARCLVSPSGYLYTSVSDFRSTPLRTVDGDSFQVAEIGSITPDPANVGGSVLVWLTSQARDLSIGIHQDTSLQRIVFEEGDVVGAVFATADGPLAVRARHGITVSSGGPQLTVAAGQPLPVDGGALRLCLVGQTASRFGRVELLTSEPLARGAASNCRRVSRRLHANVHETHSHLQAWRCGKVNKYPPLGQ
jgi:NAD(P)-dependent dehydrogenase (short-subunit alcohol dehydrogenase family)